MGCKKKKKNHVQNIYQVDNKTGVKTEESSIGKVRWFKQWTEL
jgi:hypothetical protein